MPDLASRMLSSWFFHSLAMRQSQSCILEEGSSQQQSNILVGLAKNQER